MTQKAHSKPSGPRSVIANPWPHALSRWPRFWGIVLLVGLCLQSPDPVFSAWKKPAGKKKKGLASEHPDRQSASAAKSLAKARTLREKGKGEMALNELKKALQIDPSLAEAYLEAADLYVALGSLEKALETLNAGIPLGEQQGIDQRLLGNAFCTRARLRVQFGQPDLASGDLLKAIAILPGDPSPHLTMAEIQARRGQVDAAIASYRQAVRADTSLVDAWWALGELALKRKKLEVIQEACAGLERCDSHKAQAFKEMMSAAGIKYRPPHPGTPAPTAPADDPYAVDDPYAMPGTPSPPPAAPIPTRTSPVPPGKASAGNSSAPSPNRASTPPAPASGAPVSSSQTGVRSTPQPPGKAASPVSSPRNLPAPANTAIPAPPTAKPQPAHAPEPLPRPPQARPSAPSTPRSSTSRPSAPVELPKTRPASQPAVPAVKAQPRAPVADPAGGELLPIPPSTTPLKPKPEAVEPPHELAPAPTTTAPQSDPVPLPPEPTTPQPTEPQPDGSETGESDGGFPAPPSASPPSPGPDENGDGSEPPTPLPVLPEDEPPPPAASASSELPVRPIGNSGEDAHPDFPSPASDAQPGETPVPASPPLSEDPLATMINEEADNLLGVLLTGDDATKPEARSALASMGDKALPKLQGALGHPDPRLRIEALEILGTMGETGKGALPAIQNALNDADPEVRNKANQVLSTLGQ